LPFVPLRIADGYTLKGQTSGKGYSDSDSLPVVHFEYRPPLALEMTTFRRDLREARSGEEEHKVRVAFVVARLVKWDVEGSPPEYGVLPIDVATVGRLPDEILVDLASETAKWKPKPEAEARKNS
jgi:hypothetical protein